MSSGFSTRVFTTSLAIFAMLFGAGNLIFPLRIGVQSGGHFLTGFLGFALTGIILPVMGLLAIVAYRGSYEEFFRPLGRIFGPLFIFCCMMVIGPFIVMPRIMALSYEMLSSVLPMMPIIVFTALFALIVFLATYRLNKVLDVIGKYLSPIKVASLGLIIGVGVITASKLVVLDINRMSFFLASLADGYLTLDLLGTIFFGSIIVRLLSEYGRKEEHIDLKKAMVITAFSGLFAGLLLGLVYLGMVYLGAAYGEGLEALNEGQIFSAIALRILGVHGAILIAAVVFIAGLTTIASLTVVVGEYLHRLFPRVFTYSKAIAVVLLISAFIANCGLGAILGYSKPFILFFYPLIVVVTLCNLISKIFGVTFVKIPVLLTAILYSIYWFMV